MKESSWMKCWAIGMPAKSLVLENGNKVVLYFCWWRDNLEKILGMVYLMKDSFVVLRSRTEIPHKRLQIQFGKDVIPSGLSFRGRMYKGTYAVSFCTKRVLPCTSVPLRNHGRADRNRFRGSRHLCSSSRCSKVDGLVIQTRSLANFPTAPRIWTASERRIAICAGDWKKQLGNTTRKSIAALNDVTMQCCTSRSSDQWTSSTRILFKVLRAHISSFRWRSRVCNSYMHLAW